MENIEEIINDEKYNLELKLSVNFQEPKTYLKTVSSFSNGYDVGYLIFGIKDKTKEIIGVQNVKDSLEEISQKIKSRIEPKINPIIDIVQINGKNLIVVKILPGNHPPYYYVNKGTHTAYIRTGDEDNECDNLQLNELILRGENIGWDEQLTEKSESEFTFHTLTKYFKDIKNIDITRDDLVSFELIKDNKITNAATLFSDQNPNIQSFISCTRWNGLEKISAKDDVEFYGSILDQINNSVEFLKKHMSNGWKIIPTQIARKEIPEYDIESFREGIINATAHRQYLMRGSQIQVDMFDDRICISSFGGLDYGRSLDDVINNPTSKRRNPLVCDIFSRLDYMERRGSGIAKIKKAYENDEKKPKFEIIGQTFFLTFYSRLYNNEVNKSEQKMNKSEQKINNTKFDITEKLLDLINTNNEITQKELCQELNIGRTTLSKRLNELKKSKKIERIGSTRNGYWKIIN